MAPKKKFPPMAAVVRCNGGCRAKKKMEYTAATCQEAAALCPGGPLECTNGCLGCGTCVQVCRFHAISIGPDGVAAVDPAKCTGCGACVKKCPRQVLGLHQKGCPIVVRCANHDIGNIAKDRCSASCIACRLCQKICPADAVTVSDNCAQIDEEKCLSCGACAVKCPRHVIADTRGILTPNKRST